MKIIEQELDYIKRNIVEDFVDPLPEKILTKFLTEGSKFIRSSLALLYLKALKCEITNDIYRILIAGELIHNASLLHDDVLDEADLRRGESTVAKRFSSKISILTGDLLVSDVIGYLLKLNNFEVFNLFNTCIKTMSESEIKQYFYRGKLPSEKEYLDICKGKTASLFASILESCALVANIDSVSAKKIGEKYGLIFQIKNDLDVVSAESDKNNGICTAKDVLGIEKTQDLLDNYKKDLKNILSEIPNNKYKEGLEELINNLW